MFESSIELHLGQLELIESNSNFLKFHPNYLMQSFFYKFALHIQFLEKLPMFSPLGIVSYDE